MAYTPTVYGNDNPPSLNAANLNHAENGIQAISKLTDADYLKSIMVITEASKSHSSNNDRISTNIKAGDSFMVSIKSGKAASVYAFYKDGTQTTLFGSDDKTDYFIAAKDIGAIGFYLNNNTSSDVETKILVVTSPIYDKLVAVDNVFIQYETDNFEQGTIENNKKVSTSVRLRTKKSKTVKAGDGLYIKPNGLYVSLVYATSTSATTSSALLKFTNEEQIVDIKQDGVIWILIANAATYAASTTIVVGDYDCDIRYYNGVFLAANEAVDEYDAAHIQDPQISYEIGGMSNGNITSDQARIRNVGFLYLPAGSRIVLQGPFSFSVTSTPLIVYEFVRPEYGMANVITWTGGWIAGDYTTQNDAYIKIVCRTKDAVPTDAQRDELWANLQIKYPVSIGWVLKNDIDSYSFLKIPDYYLTGIDALKNKLSLLPADNFNYILITDIHYAFNDFTEIKLKQMMAAFRNIANGANIDVAFCLGDIIEGGKNADKTDSKNRMNAVMNEFVGIQKPIIQSKGNHDDNAYNWSDFATSDKTTDKVITDNEIINIMERPFGRSNLVYYVDFPGKGIRVINANTCEYSQVIDGTNVSMSKSTSIVIPDSEIDVLAQYMLDSEYDIVFVTHGLIEKVFTLIKEYNSRSSHVNSDSSVISFANVTKKVMLMHTGHYHNDAMEYQETYDVNVISTSCGSLASTEQNSTGNGSPLLTSWVGSASQKITTIYPRTKNTINEACFDVVSIGHGKITKLRFGAGADGELTY